MEILLDGFSRVKKSNATGRANMIMDLQVISSVLEKLSKKKLNPYLSFYLSIKLFQTSSRLFHGDNFLEGFIPN